MKIAAVLFEGMAALDVVGPLEVLNHLPKAVIHTVGLRPGPVRAEYTGLELVAAEPLEAMAAPDLLLMPGGAGTRALMRDERVLDWVRTAAASAEWTFSVCTGSLVLGAAGLLAGKRATTHWAARDWLREFDAEPVTERYVFEDRLLTAAGVSAGIDAALALFARIAGEAFAQGVQLGIEYDPQPPFDAGSPEKAPKPLVELVRSQLAASGAL